MRPSATGVRHSSSVSPATYAASSAAPVLCAWQGHLHAYSWLNRRNRTLISTSLTRRRIRDEWARAFGATAKRRRRIYRPCKHVGLCLEWIEEVNLVDRLETFRKIGLFDGEKSARGNHRTCRKSERGGVVRRRDHPAGDIHRCISDEERTERSSRSNERPQRPPARLTTRRSADGS